MPTVVQDKNGHQYVVLGAGYSTLPKLKKSLIHEYPTNQHHNPSCALVVCDVNGDVLFIKPNDLKVVSVDGVAPEEILKST